MIGILIGCLTLVVVGWAIVKGKYAPLVLFASGAFMLACAVFFDTGTFMPKKALPTGNDYLNIIEFIRYMFSNRLAGLGFLIMTMVGFASYMTHIGANDAFVNIAIKPLSIIRNPYILIFVAFMLGKAVSMVITSAVGLGVLCLALMGPALAALGINKKAIGAVFVTSGACSLVLLGGSTAASAKACDLSILDYVFLFKIPAGIPTVLAIGLAHVFWQRWLDRREGWNCEEHKGETLVFSEDVKRPSTAAPKIYAFLPFLPMVLVVVFSQYCISSIKLDITALMLLCVIIGMVCEVIRWRGNYDKIAAGLKVFLQSMGKALSGVVALVIAAGVFAEGFKALGMLDAIVDVAHNVGAGAVGMSILFVAITTLVTIIAGSNGASFYPLVEMVPKIARDMGVNPVTLVLPMHQASTIARPLSPVAGVVVAIAGMLQMNPFELIKRASVPCIVGLIVHHVSVFWLAIGLAHVFWQRWLDRREGWNCEEHKGETLVFSEDVKRPSTAAPKIYAFLPFLPMVLVVVFSQYCISSIKLDITALMLLCVIIGMVCEVIRWRGNYDKIAAGLKVFLQSMGKALSGVVALVIAAGVFAEGFKALGMLDAIVDVAHNVGAGAVGMSILFVAITTLVTIIAGSNGASFYPLVEMVPKIARDMGVNPVTLVLPMHQASTIARPLSPVAGVVVAIAGMLQMNPFELIKRASVPCIVGLIVHHVSVFWLAI